MAIQVQDRDIELLAGMVESRVMTVDHAAELYFGGSREAAKKRIQKLKAERLIRERPRRSYEPAVLFATKGGVGEVFRNGRAEALRTLGTSALERRLRVSELTIRHELEVLDVKAAFARAARSRPGISVSEFSTWPALFQFTVVPSAGYERRLIQADGFIRVREGTAEEPFEHSFFLEVDRSTETLGGLASKLRCYLDWYRAGGFAERQGGSRDRIEEHPFRVLVVCKSAERRDNLARALSEGEPKVRTQAMISTLRAVKEDPLGPHWLPPAAFDGGAAGPEALVP